MLNFKAYLLRHYNVGIEKKLYRQTELQLIGVITLMICRLDGLRKYKKQIIREQRSLSRKYENLKKGGATQRVNIQKQRLKVQKLHHKINNIRTDYSNKTIAEIVKTKHLTLSRCEHIQSYFEWQVQHGNEETFN